VFAPSPQGPAKRDPNRSAFSRKKKYVKSNVDSQSQSQNSQRPERKSKTAAKNLFIYNL